MDVLGGAVWSGFSGLQGGFGYLRETVRTKLRPKRTEAELHDLSSFGLGRAAVSQQAAAAHVVGYRGDPIAHLEESSAGVLVKREGLLSQVGAGVVEKWRYWGARFDLAFLVANLIKIWI